MLNYKLTQAIIDAQKFHREQTRKSCNKEKIPYMTHLIEVGFILSKYYPKNNVIIAGILHDTLEDTDIKEKEIKQKYGEEILNLIKWVSEEKNKSINREEKILTWKKRKIRQLERLKKAPLDAKIIAVADEISNLNSLIIELENNNKVKVEKLFNATLKDKLEVIKKKYNVVWDNIKYSNKLKDLKDVHKNMIDKLINILDK